MARGKHSISLFEVSRKDSTRGYPYKKPQSEAAKVDQTQAAPSVNDPNIQVSRSVVFLACMITLVLVSGAFLLGQKVSLSRETPDPLLAPVQEDVTNLSPQYSYGIDRGPERPAAASNASNPVPVAAQGRIIGLNYIIVQSYPPEERKWAEEAVAILKENGVQATIEKRPARYGAATWLSVITTAGFEKISSPQYQNLVNKIESASSKNIKGGSFKAFKPSPYKWDATN